MTDEPQLELQYRHLFRESDDVSLCEMQSRDGGGAAVAVEVEHLDGMKWLCADCKDSAKQYQHMRDPMNNSTTDTKFITVDFILDIFLYILFMGVVLALLITFHEGIVIFAEEFLTFF